MAKRDVIKFYKQEQSVYLDMVESVKEVDAAFRAGRLEESVAEDLKKQLMIIRENYERISYIVYLLNLPIKEKNKQDYIEENFQVEEYLKKKHADDLSAIKESKHALDELKRIIKENLSDE